MQTIMIQLNNGSKDYDYRKAKEIHDAIRHLYQIRKSLAYKIVPKNAWDELLNLNGKKQLQN